ncbi:MAG: alpha-glucosidase C-terminal domain-containing protein [Gemmatimonadetes bacterium]|nr:alpha-glucosidase C-terminal domain-containing protein [Gemmatimonadota bacterium]
MPVITDSVYGYQSINVEAQQKSPFSLLNWMKRLIQVRKQHRAFGRGSIEFLEPENPHVLAYLREYDGDTLLVVNNLSGTAQPVRLDLSRFAGRTPVELLGQTAFLPIDETAYALTLSPYGFFWFGLRATHADEDEEGGIIPSEWLEREMELFESPQTLTAIVSAIPHEWILRQRWFRSKAREIQAVELFDRAIVAPEKGPHLLLTVMRVRHVDEHSDLYLVPLSFRPALGMESDAEPVLTYASETGKVRLFEALLDQHSSRVLLSAIDEEKELVSASGVFRGHRTEVLDRVGTVQGQVRRIEGEQSNTSIVYGDRLILKVFRKLESGINPDLEITRFLVENTSFGALPALAGWIDYQGSGGLQASVAALFEFVPNKGDAWSYTLRAINRYLAAASRSAADPSTTAGREGVRRMAGDYLVSARRLGTVTGEMHAALASAGQEHADFTPEPIRSQDIEQWTEQFQRHASGVLGEVGRRLDALPGAFPQHILNDLAAIVREAPNIREQLAGLRILQQEGLVKTRFHGDYHLGQLLRAADVQPGEPGEWIVLDFEGEPARPLAERRAKHSPLRDVAGMLRSFNYAVRMALSQQENRTVTGSAPLEEWAAAWEREIRAQFLEGYREAAAGAPFLPADPTLLRQLLAVFEMEKAVYELGYEANNRPDWIWVPVEGIRAIMEGRA